MGCQNEPGLLQEPLSSCQAYIPTRRVETVKEHAQFTVASDQEEMVQVEKSGTETQDGVELKDHSTPPSCFKHFPISTSQKDSYTIFSHSSPDAMTFQATMSNQEVVA
ncbi:hypothetical protein HID58_014377 [Brassica napus]|uniref:Uncharacterized protein n=1 Tax=Brassica napus TaxID=3708 RepID=A0ABQ8DH00_BRANA|nr:hypothetical protein HID58_014377 [Brassica napus]